MGRRTEPGAAGKQRGVFDVGEDRALKALRLAWSGAYDIGSEHGRRAVRRGDLLTERTPPMS